VPPPPPPPAAAPRAPFAGPLVVNQPVRSGQVIYAQNNDLVVMAPVNAGAQVIADGHVHIYATLRGRAVAGAQGLPGARLFVQKLEAELIAIAGAYMLSDEIPAPARGRAVQVYLEDGQCRIAPL
jgi:septum site-determining protein MinC